MAKQAPQNSKPAGNTLAPSAEMAASPETAAAPGNEEQPRSVAELRLLLAQAEADELNKIDPKDLEGVRIYNRSRKQIRHGDHLSAPNSFITVPRWLATKWLDGLPDVFVSGDEALKAVDGSSARADAAEAKNAELEKEKAALALELAELRKKVSGGSGGPEQQ